MDDEDDQNVQEDDQDDDDEINNNDGRNITQTANQSRYADSRSLQSKLILGTNS